MVAQPRQSNARCLLVHAELVKEGLRITLFQHLSPHRALGDLLSQFPSCLGHEEMGLRALVDGNERLRLKTECRPVDGYRGEVVIFERRDSNGTSSLLGEPLQDLLLLIGKTSD
jgi:hypothetical protein